MNMTHRLCLVLGDQLSFDLASLKGLDSERDTVLPGLQACASGQYIKRMSDCCRHCAYKVSESTTDDACPFNSLYWHFLMRHGDLLRSNQRMGMGMGMVYKNLDRMTEAKQEALWKRGQKLLAKLDAGGRFEEE